LFSSLREAPADPGHLPGVAHADCPWTRWYCRVFFGDHPRTRHTSEKLYIFVTAGLSSRPNTQVTYSGKRAM
jgi:hypothetical protein